MGIIAQNNTLYQQIDTRKSYFLKSHMSLYLKYQGNYHGESRPDLPTLSLKHAIHLAVIAGRVQID